MSELNCDMNNKFYFCCKIVWMIVSELALMFLSGDCFLFRALVYLREFFTEYSPLGESRLRPSPEIRLTDGSPLPILDEGERGSRNFFFFIFI